MDSGHAPSSWIWERRKRVFSTTITRASDPSNIITLCISSAAVFSIAFVEGFLKTARSGGGAGGVVPLFTRVQFSAVYARAQLLPSIIWLTSDAQDIVNHRFKHCSGTLLEYNLNAAQRRFIFGLMVLRSVVFGFVGIAQILRVVEIASTAEGEFRDRVARGVEPLFDSDGTTLKSRIIRLAGTSSDVTDRSVARFGHHIVPIFELQQALANNSQRDANSGDENSDGNGGAGSASNNTLFPNFWCVKDGQYGNRAAWRGFEPKKSWLFERKNSTPLLIVEADSSVPEQSLSLSEAAVNDLSLSECAAGFSMIRRLALQTGVVSDKKTQVLRVMLCDANAKKHSGGGFSVTQREFLKQRDEVDVIIDAHAPLIQHIIKFLNSNSTVILDTDSEAYFKSVSAALAKHGKKVLDRHDPQLAAISSSSSLPRLIYNDTTSETLTSAESLLRAKLCSADSLCLLLDNPPRNIAQDLSDRGLSSVATVCSSHIYDELFERVRQLATSGGEYCDFGAIQRQIDSEIIV